MNKWQHDTCKPQWLENLEWASSRSKAPPKRCLFLIAPPSRDCSFPLGLGRERLWVGTYLEGALYKFWLIWLIWLIWFDWFDWFWLIWLNFDWVLVNYFINNHIGSTPRPTVTAPFQRIPFPGNNLANNSYCMKIAIETKLMISKRLRNRGEDRRRSLLCRKIPVIYLRQLCR